MAGIRDAAHNRDGQSIRGTLSCKAAPPAHLRRLHCQSTNEQQEHSQKEEKDTTRCAKQL